MTDFNFANIDTLKRNRELEGETGVELGLGNGITLTVLAATDANVGWRNNREKVRGELQRLATARASEERTRAFLADMFARLIVKGWDGVNDTEGNAIPFTREACTAFLMQADDAYEAINALIYDSKNFRAQRLEVTVEHVKN